MQPEQIELVQDSFKKVAPIADKAAELFYGKLFEIAPEVKPLFKEDISEQGAKLMQMIGIAVRGLNNLESIVPAVQQLGRNHVGYGVKEEHFAPVAEALLWTLEQGLGEDWNDKLKAAWTEAYVILSSTMIDAMKEEDEPVTLGFFAKLKSIFAPA
ncbi:MAG: globin family protein [Pseudomonadota bacterium]